MLKIGGLFETSDTFDIYGNENSRPSQNTVLLPIIAGITHTQTFDVLIRGLYIIEGYDYYYVINTQEGGFYVYKSDGCI